MTCRISLLKGLGTPKIESPQLWDEPEPTAPTPAQLPPSPQEARRARYRRRYPNSPPTDVIEWLANNKPLTYAELMDLRKTLYSRKRCFGKYYVTQRGKTSLGEERFTLNGPGGAVLILSNKCRHYLLRTLNRLRSSKGWPPIAYR